MILHSEKSEERLEAYHDDYSKPLYVVWLCSVCHGARYRKYDYIKLME